MFPGLKRTLFIFLMTLLFSHGLSAQEFLSQHNVPHRYFSLGIDAGAGFYTDFAGAADFFLKNLFDPGKGVDFPETLGQPISLTGGLGGSIVLDISGGDTWGFTVNVGIEDTVFDLGFPRSVLDFFTDAAHIAEQGVEGDVSFSGAVYAEAGVAVHFKASRFFVKIKPSYFLPLVYIPEGTVHYAGSVADGRARLETTGSADVYTLVPVNGLINADLGTILNAILPNAGDGGVDLDVTLEYPFFNWFDMGVTLENYPIMPSKLGYKASVPLDYTLVDAPVEDLAGPSVTIPALPDSLSSSAVEAYNIYRPLTLSVYANFRPFGGLGGEFFTDLLTLRPWVGYSQNVLDNDARYVNFGLDMEMNFARRAYIYASTGLKNGAWKHSAGVIFNFRIIELQAGLSMRSRASMDSIEAFGGSFVDSFDGRGLSASVGLHFGY
jgi:hypothetical protein